MYLFIDTETTGLPEDYNAPISDSDNWPRLVQLAYQLTDRTGNLLKDCNMVVYPDDFTIPFESTQVHNISTEQAKKIGKPISDVLNDLEQVMSKALFLIGHNVEFDKKIIEAEVYRSGLDIDLNELISFCTMKCSSNFCEIPSKYGYKYPTLEELQSKIDNLNPIGSVRDNTNHSDDNIKLTVDW